MSNEYKDWAADLAQDKLHNKTVCDKYPILIPRHWKTGKVVKKWDYENTMLDDIPTGWRIAFGEQWAKDVQEAINKIPQSIRGKIYILQLKEKFGEFRQYFSHYTDDLNAVIHKYEKLSRKTCIHCGEPATRISTGWISPWCDTCVKKINDKSVSLEEFLNEYYTED